MYHHHLYGFRIYEIVVQFCLNNIIGKCVWYCLVFVRCYIFVHYYQSVPTYIQTLLHVLILLVCSHLFADEEFIEKLELIFELHKYYNIVAFF